MPSFFADSLRWPSCHQGVRDHVAPSMAKPCEAAMEGTGAPPRPCQADAWQPPRTARLAPPPGLGFGSCGLARRPSQSEAARLLQIATQKARTCKKLHQRLRLSVLHNGFVAHVQAALLPAKAPLESVFWPVSPLGQQSTPARDILAKQSEYFPVNFAAAESEPMDGVWAASPSDNLVPGPIATVLPPSPPRPARPHDAAWERRPLEDANGRTEGSDDTASPWCSSTRKGHEAGELRAAACLRQLWETMPALDLQKAVSPRRELPSTPSTDATEMTEHPHPAQGGPDQPPVPAVSAPSHAQEQRKERRRTRRKSLDLTCPRRRRHARSGSHDACGSTDRPRLIWRPPTFGVAC